MKHAPPVTRKGSIGMAQAHKAVRDYLRHRSDDDWYEDPSVFFGFGSMHDLRDADQAPPRLAGMRSVRQVNVRLRDEPKAAQRPQLGFHVPKVRR